MLMTFISLWRTDNYVSTVLVVALAWYQFHSGMSYPLLQYPNRKAPPSDARWLPRLREYLADIGGSIRLDNPQILPLLRTNDRAIMDVAIQVTQDEDHLRRINHCRLYINAFSIADITNVNGDRLDERYFEGDERIPLIASQVTIYQGKPDPTSWYRWDEFLCRISDRRGKLLQPLGEWLVAGNSIRRRHDHYLETKTDCTYSYESSTGTWLRRTRMPTVTDDLDQRLYGDPVATEWEPTATAYPIDAAFDDTTLQTMHPDVILPPTVPTARNFQAFCKQKTGKHWYLLKHVEYKASPFVLATMLNEDGRVFNLDIELGGSSAILGVSDGSEAKKHMTYGWSLRNSRQEQLITCSGSPPGEGQSHRAEANGMLSMVWFLSLLQEFTKIPITVPLHLYTDNSGLIKRINERNQWKHNYPSTTLLSDWDLVEEICRLMKTLKTFTINHVRGHMDKKKSYEQCSNQEQMNIDADELADKHRKRHGVAIQPQVPLFETTKCHLDIKGKTITNHFRSNIRKATSLPAYLQGIEETWKNRFKMTDCDLEVFRKHQSKPDEKSMFNFKFVHRCLPTQKQKSYHEPCDDKCPLCGEVDDHNHFLLCTHESVKPLRTTFVSSLRQTICQQTSNYELQTLVVESVSAWLHQEPMQPPNTEPLRSVYLAQEKIGWDAFLRGFFSAEWNALSPNLKWREKVMNIFYSKSHDLWIHHCDKIHSADNLRKERDSVLRLRARIRQLHTEFYTTVLHRHRNILSMDKDNLEKDRDEGLAIS